jgi:arylsulfatase A-like enzyme
MHAMPARVPRLGAGPRRRDGSATFAPLVLEKAIVRALAPLLVLGCGAGDETTARGPAAKTSVILVVVDSLRADRLGVYGYDRPTSPFLDRFAGDAVVFERAWAPSSYTSQSVAALLTGRLPSSGGSTGLQEAEPAVAATTLAEHFRRGGFRTAIVSSQPLLRRRAFTRGFEDIQVAALDESWPALEVTRRALDYLDGVGGEPFFLLLDYADPHQPYQAPPEIASRFAAGDVEIDVPGMQAALETGEVAAGDPRVAALGAAYDAEVATVDAGLELLVRGLEERRLGSSAIVVTASQGEELLDHGWWGHAWTLHEEVLRVPLLLRAPGLDAAPIAEPVSLVDLSPSLLTLAGLDGGALDGDGDAFLRADESGLRLHAAGRPKIAELVIRERCVHRAVLDGHWKYVATVVDCPLGERRAIAADYPNRLKGMAQGSLVVPEVWGPPLRESIYDLAADPGESRDLAAESADRRTELRRVLENYAARVREHGLAGAKPVAPADLVDPDQVERLESLGYL